MPPSPHASIGTAGTILLIEEYDALAAAFGSAIRRLAPDKQVLVARSFSEAETIATTMRPDLFVIDCDPPPERTLTYLNRLKSRHPDARVLIIAASTWPELEHERPQPGAFNFIEKPFALPKLGALLQSLLPSGGLVSPSMNIGALRDLDLIDMIALFGTTGTEINLKITALGGSTGEIYFAGGQLTRASASGKSGTSALEEMLRWRSPRFSEATVREDRPRTIRGRWMITLSAALRATRGSEFIPAERPAVSDVSVLPEKKIVVIDDTELLLVLVEDVLHSARPSLKIVTAPNGFEGLRRTAETMPDLVLLDYSLPDIQGDEVCRLLLEDPQTARIPVIMMSGHVAEMASTAVNYSNVIASIAKPFLSAALVSLVETTLTELDQPSQKRERSQRSPRAAIANEKSVPEPPAPPPFPATTDPKQAERPPPQERAGPPAPEPAPALPEPIDSPPTFEKSPEKASEIPPSETAPAPPSSPQVVLPALEPAHEWTEENETESAPAEASATARIPEAKENTVILALPLEITSIQFSNALQVKAIRAKPSSSIVSVHILPSPTTSSEVVAKNFELESVDLDGRGQIRAIHLAPAPPSSAEPVGGNSLTVAELAALSGGTEVIQLLADPTAPMPIHLLTLFELVAVELGEGFAIGRLMLRTRSAKVRVKLARENLRTGLTFRSAQVLLDHSAKIADVLLDAPV